MGRPHTGHDAVFTGTRQARPTKIVTFPRDKAEKSPFQQHDLSILIVGPNQLKNRLSRTRKPKSHPSSNTQCPITPCSPNEAVAGPAASQTPRPRLVPLDKKGGDPGTHPGPPTPARRRITGSGAAACDRAGSPRRRAASTRARTPPRSPRPTRRIRAGWGPSSRSRCGSWLHDPRRRPPCRLP